MLRSFVVKGAPQDVTVVLGLGKQERLTAETLRIRRGEGPRSIVAKKAAGLEDSPCATAPGRRTNHTS